MSDPTPTLLPANHLGGQSAAKVIALSELVPPPAPEPVREIGGRRDGPDPTRYGDWEKNGRCIDF